MNTHCNSSSFLKGAMKMDEYQSFGEHNKTDEQPYTGETIPFTPGGMIHRKPSWEPVRKQETSFGGTSQRSRLKESFVEKLLYAAIQINRSNARSIPFR